MADRVDEIAALLMRTGQAHGKYEQEKLNGVYDEDWARWYAGYAVEQGISASVGHMVTVDQLADFFTASFAEYKSARSGEEWANYTARKMQMAL